MQDDGITRDERLIQISRVPFNAETPLALYDDGTTSASLFYVRNHFPVPTVDPGTWRLPVGGAVRTPLELTYGELLAMPSRTVAAALECAGNGRVGFDPPAEGEPWQYGAVSNARWTGVPLAAVLERAGVGGNAVELYADSHDRGFVPAARATISFERSMPLSRALDPDTLLAYAMNGELLTPDHGFPVRLLVPGWYGMASVKWLARLEILTTPFTGFYQANRYVLPAGDGTEPLGPMRIRSVFTSPAENLTMPLAEGTMRGLAWSGHAPIMGVEVRVDDGPWETAECTSEAERYAWREWVFRWIPPAPGQYTLQCRATDAAGNTQPETAEWNRLGYANNAIQRRIVTIA